MSKTSSQSSIFESCDPGSDDEYQSALSNKSSHEDSPSVGHVMDDVFVAVETESEALSDIPDSSSDTSSDGESSDDGYVFRRLFKLDSNRVELPLLEYVEPIVTIVKPWYTESVLNTAVTPILAPRISTHFAEDEICSFPTAQGTVRALVDATDAVVLPN